MKTSKNKIIVYASFAAILCVAALNANAQEPAPAAASSDASGKMCEIGVRFMPTFSSFQMRGSGGNTISGSVTFGYGVGAIAGLNFSDHVGIQGEILYYSISQKYKESNVTREVNLRYVNIPLLLSLNTGKSKPVNLNFVVGPQIGISAGGNVHTSGGDGTTTADAILVVKKGDLGFAYGAGLDFGLNSARTFRLGVGFRGVYGLFDISDDSRSANTNEFLILDKSHVKTYSGYLGLSLLF